MLNQKSTHPRSEINRRRFLQTLMLVASVVVTSIGSFLPAWMKWNPARLRPPGALDEELFLAACIKCGQCVQVCPVNAIHLADLSDSAGIGVPYIDAREQACDFSCDILQCVLACPTGALTHAISQKEEVRMGVARVVSVENCLAYHGLGFKGLARGRDYNGLLRYSAIDRWQPILVREHPYELELCDLCVRQCPIEKAIYLKPIDEKRKTPVITEQCVGCGVCEMICPIEPAVIVIDERQSRKIA